MPRVNSCPGGNQVVLTSLNLSVSLNQSLGSTHIFVYTGTVAFIFREQGMFSNYFQGTGELLTRLLGSREHQFTFNNGQ